MSVTSPEIIVGFGGPTIDYHVHALANKKLDPTHEPGAKRDFTPQDYLRYAQLLQKPDSYTIHPGGNVTGNLTYLRAQGYVTHLCTTLGTDSEVSQRIIDHHEWMGVTTKHVIREEGYEPAISMVQKGTDENGELTPRMVRGRPRGPFPLGVYLSNQHIEAALDGADSVLLASTKSPELNERILHLAEGRKKFVNFGSSELGDPEAAQITVESFNPDVVALNDDELRALYPDQPDASLEQLGERLSRHVTWVLCTLGKKGLFLAHNGDLERAAIEFTPCAAIDPKEIVNDLGAGDRAMAITVDSYLRGVPAEKVPNLVAEGTLAALRVQGAHQDLYPSAA